MLNFLTKHYWWITILLIGIAIILDLSFDTVKTVRTPMTITNSVGKQQTFEVLSFEDTYRIIRALVNILYSLGVSLIVLVALDKRIDSEENQKYQKELQRLDEKIHNNIFDGILNKFVPEDLFDQVKKDIFKTDIVRKNARWTYQITNNSHNSFNLIQTIQYEIENITDGRIEKDIPVNINFNSILMDTKITNWKLKSDKGVLEKEETSNFGIIKVFLDSRETKKIELNILNEYKTEAVMDAHISNFSIIGLDIQIQKPEDVEIKLDPTFSSKLIMNQPNSQLIMFNRIPCVLLGQGILFIIEKKKNC